MTVKCLTPKDKDTLAALYLNHRSVYELALAFHRSPRTILRVLEERGCAPVSQRQLKQARQHARVFHLPMRPIPTAAQLPLAGVL